MFSHDLGGKRAGPGTLDEYYRPVPPGILADIKTFFGLDERFPFDQLYVRSGEEFPKSICYLTRTIKTNIVDKDIKHDLKVRSLCTFYCIYCHSVSPVESSKPRAEKKALLSRKVWPEYGL